MARATAAVAVANDKDGDAGSGCRQALRLAGLAAGARPEGARASASTAFTPMLALAQPHPAVDEKPWSHRYSEENLQYREENDYWWGGMGRGGTGWGVAGKARARGWVWGRVGWGGCRTALPRSKRSQRCAGLFSG